MERQSRIALAAGMVKTIEDVQRVIALPVNEVTIGSITLVPKEGNPGTAFYTDGAGNYWNAIGLKNGGVPYYRAHLAQIAAMVRSAKCTLVVSISGQTADENGALARMVVECAGTETIIELNLACPNVVVDAGERKPLIGYSVEATRDHIAAISVVEEYPGDILLRLKVPPYMDLELQKGVAGIISSMSHIVRITEVVATNTMGNCYPMNDDGTPAITVGHASGSGEQLHALAVGNVKQWCKLLPPSVGVIGVGGVCEARHVRHFEGVGARACQMAGAYHHEGDRAFHHVLGGL